MKSYSILACLVLAACQPQGPSDAEIAARNICFSTGFDYENSVYDDCLEYVAYIKPIKDSDKEAPSWPEYLCSKEQEVNSELNIATCLQQKESLVKKREADAKLELSRREKAEKERLIQAEKAEKERERLRLKAIADQKAADGSKCKEYGFKKGSEKFAECVMKIEQARSDEITAQRNLAAQMAMQEAAMAQQAQLAEAQRRQAGYAALMNYNAQMQQTQAINNAAYSLQNQRVQTNCYAFGNNLNCY